MSRRWGSAEFWTSAHIRIKKVEYEEAKRVCEAEGDTFSSWARQVIREALSKRREPLPKEAGKV